MNHIRQQIRDAVKTALTGLSTTGANVFDSRVYELNDAELPALRIFTNGEDVEIESMGLSRLHKRTLELVVEACVKQNGVFDDTLDAIIKEIEVALAANQGAGGAKWIQLQKIEVELAGEGEKPAGVGRMTFQVPYITALGAPDVAL
jgi:hypothetical protein